VPARIELQSFLYLVEVSWRRRRRRRRRKRKDYSKLTQ